MKHKKMTKNPQPFAQYTTALSIFHYSLLSTHDKRSRLNEVVVQTAAVDDDGQDRQAPTREVVCNYLLTYLQPMMTYLPTYLPKRVPRYLGTYLQKGPNIIIIVPIDGAHSPFIISLGISNIIYHIYFLLGWAVGVMVISLHRQTISLLRGRYLPAVVVSRPTDLD